MFFRLTLTVFVHLFCCIAFESIQREYHFCLSDIFPGFFCVTSNLMFDLFLFALVHCQEGLLLLYRAPPY